RLEWPIDAAEHAAALMVHLGELAMHRRGRAHHITAERLADRLVAKADAEHRNVGGGRIDQIEADAGLVGRAPNGRPHDRVGLRADHMVDRDLVVAMHDHVGPEPAQIVDEVEGEAVVIVDQDDHAVSLAYFGSYEATLIGPAGLRWRNAAPPRRRGT